MILSIDTSGSDCGVALWGDNLIGLRKSEGGLRHNEVLLNHIQSLLSEHNLQHDDISAVAVSTGPGSFTGLRVGMAAAKGLCWTWRIPFIAIPSMEGLAAAVPPRMKKVMTLMPARAQEVYWALFEYSKEDWKRQREDQVSELSQLGKRCKGEIFLFGEGYTKHKTDLDRIFSGRLLALVDDEQTETLAVSVARLATERYKRGDFDDLMETEPKYCYAFPRRKK